MVTLLTFAASGVDVKFEASKDDSGDVADGGSTSELFQSHILLRGTVAIATCRVPDIQRQLRRLACTTAAATWRSCQLPSANATSQDSSTSRSPWPGRRSYHSVSAEKIDHYILFFNISLTRPHQHYSVYYWF